MDEVHKISVLMSVYNGGKLLKKSIESVLEQTYKNIELIIIDDCSTDNSGEIIKSYQDDRIFFIQNDENIGLTESLNKALDYAKGSIIARIDHDDICFPKRFEKQVNYFNNHPDCDLLFSDVEKIDSKGNTIQTKNRIKCSEDIYYYMHFINPVIHPTLMTRRQLLKDIGGFNSEFKYAQDYELWSKLIYKYKFDKINEPLLYYRESEQQISKDKLSEQSIYAEKISLKILKNVFPEADIDDLKYFHKSAFKDDYKNIDFKKLSLFKKLNKKIIEKAPNFLDRSKIEKTTAQNYYYYLSVYLRKFKIFNPMIDFIKGKI